MLRSVAALHTTRTGITLLSLLRRDYTGFLRVRQGDKVALWDRSGRLSVIEGPHASFVFQKEVVPLVNYLASPSQYIVVEHKDGRIEHIQGPTSLTEDLIAHKKIGVKDGIALMANKGIAVWKKGERKENMKSVFGPATYFPLPDELIEDIWCFVATSNQYVRVQYLDGRIEHLKGPTSIWFNPSIHSDINMLDAVDVLPGSAIMAFDNEAAESKKGRIIEGPATFFPGPFERYVKLKSVTAGDLEFIKIHYHDGRIEHRPGPTVVHEDPEEMKSVLVQPMVTIGAHHAMLLYSFKDTTIDHTKIADKSKVADSNVIKRIVYGPRVVIPQPNEWIHNFSWHGTDIRERASGNVVGRKIPGGLRFEKLRLIPDAFYYDVENVRTADDALLAMKFMVYYELTDVEKMINQTHDPIAELINALTSDAIEFTNKRSFEQFKADTEMLSKLETYQHIVSRSARIGFSISKIVYRGYHSSDKLQQMHDQVRPQPFSVRQLVSSQWAYAVLFHSGN